MAADSDMRRRIIAATLDLTAAQGWTSTRLADIAAAAGLSLAELYRHYRSRQAIIADLGSLVDEEVLEAPASGTEAEPIRDRLFDLLMRRFDALQPFKPGLAVLVRTGRGDPLLLCAGGASLMRSMRWTLEAVGVGGEGVAGRMRVRGLAIIYVDVLRTWLSDDSEDLGRTMAALDGDLKRADRLMAMCSCKKFGRSRPRAPSDAAPAEPAAGPAPGPA